MPSRSHCYGCNQEVWPVLLPDFEASCPQCGSSCLEELPGSAVSTSTAPEAPEVPRGSQELRDAPWSGPPSGAWGVALPQPAPGSMALDFGPNGPFGPMVPGPALTPVSPVPVSMSGPAMVSLMPMPPIPMPPPSFMSIYGPSAGPMGPHTPQPPATLLMANSRSSRSRRRQGPIGAPPGHRHFGVICDGCHERDFQGTRYRCLSCRDYDLCANCHSQRGELHPEHSFEAINTPRLPLPAAIADLMSSSVARTVYAILEVGFEAEDQEMHSGLDDGKISWWLADDRRLVSADVVAAEEPDWSCPICSDGLEGENNGWLVRICRGDEADSNEACGGRPGEIDGHMYHEGCLRRWLMKRNSCPVCRRSPVVPA
ncbi:unnamed protein product [Durusdinium trenchii]|uniref:Uncharacterized protein n=2 Tax=Durusdinium trenchii TaxID=1381693 RepID=A0ABP0S4F6_9DINO